MHPAAHHGCKYTFFLLKFSATAQEIGFPCPRARRHRLSVSGWLSNGHRLKTTKGCYLPICGFARNRQPGANLKKRRLRSEQMRFDRNHRPLRPSGSAASGGGRKVEIQATSPQSARRHRLRKKSCPVPSRPLETMAYAPNPENSYLCKKLPDR